MADTTYTGQSTKGVNSAEIGERIKQGKAEGTMSDKAAVAGGMSGDLGSKGKGGAGMPKQREGETPAQFGARLRLWREEHSSEEATTRRKALLP